MFVGFESLIEPGEFSYTLTTNIEVVFVASPSFLASFVAVRTEITSPTSFSGRSVFQLVSFTLVTSNAAGYSFFYFYIERNRRLRVIIVLRGSIESSLVGSGRSVETTLLLGRSVETSLLLLGRSIKTTLLLLRRSIELVLHFLGASTTDIVVVLVTS